MLFAICNLSFRSVVESAPLRVVATTSDLASVAGELGGDRVELQSICPGTQDPHFLQAKPTYTLKLRNADLLVSIGLELEKAWLGLLDEGARNPRILPGQPGNIEGSKGLEILEIPAGGVDRSLGDVHPDGNPHYMLDPRNVEVVAKNIAERLQSLDGAGSAFYAERLKAFLSRMESARAGWEKKAAGLRGKKVVVYHRDLIYLARWLGLDIVDAVENIPGVRPSSSHLADLEGKIKAQGWDLILASAFSDRAVAQSVAGKTGAALVFLPAAPDQGSGIADEFALFERIIQNLGEAGHASR